MLFGLFRLVALLAAICCCGSACKTTGIPPVIVDYAKCLNSELSPQIAGVMNEVATALASGDWKFLLSGLVSRVGGAVVDCAVHEFIGVGRARLERAPKDDLTKIQIDHAYSWLSRE